MAAEESLRSKTLYKVEIGLLKIIPMVLAGIYLSNTILSYFLDIDLIILSYIGGISLLPLIFLYLSSYVFRFCIYHRVFLHYITINEIILILDTHIGLPISDLEYFCLQMSIFGISLFLFLYLYVKSNKGPTN
jgi:hypothetical protein